MKGIMRFISALILSTVVFSVGAQDDQNVLREVSERPQYGDNWFVSLGGSPSILFAEQDSYAPWTKRVKLGLQFTGGKWFNPNFGFRVQISGGSLRGFNSVDPRPEGEGYYVINNFNHSQYPRWGDPRLEIEGEPNPNPDLKQYDRYRVTTDAGVAGLWQEFNHVTTSIDLLGNFTNLFRGVYRNTNPVDVVPHLGLGVIHAYDNGITSTNYYHFLVRLGFRVNFNVTENISIYLEPQANGTEKEFDGYAGTAFGDLFVNLGFGVQFTFNKRFTSLSQFVQITADEVDRLNTKININRNLIENHQDILERQQDLLDRLEKCCDEGNSREVVSQIVKTGTLPEYIRFTLDSYRIESSEMQKILEVSDYLRKNSSSRLLIIGYADRRTGNPRYNMDLSRKRVDAVAYELRRLGISENRVAIEWRGDREQPFPQNDWNRVVIMVERK